MRTSSFSLLLVLTLALCGPFLTGSVPLVAAAEKTDDQQAASKRGRLVITSWQPGGKILINGEETGRVTPASLRLDAGEYQVAVAFAGYGTFQFHVQLKAGETVEIHVSRSGKSTVTKTPSPHTVVSH